MRSVLRGWGANALLLASLWLLPVSAWAQSSAPPATEEVTPAPMEYPSPVPASAAPATPAETTPETINLQPQAPATLQFETTDPGANYQVTLDVGGRSVACETAIRREHPCTLHGVAPGSVRVHVTGSAVFEENVDVYAGDATVTLHYEGPANGVLAGVLLLVAAGAAGGGAAALVAACGVGTSCGNDAYDAWAVPLALLAPAFLIGGIGMLAWHRPASSSVQVNPVDAPLARARSRPAVRVSFGAAPLPGGAALGLAAQF